MDPVRIILFWYEMVYCSLEKLVFMLSCMSTACLFLIMHSLPCGHYQWVEPDISRPTSCYTPCTLNTATTEACPITYPIMSLLLLFAACCEENPTVRACVCLYAVLCVYWDVKGRLLSMCCSKRVIASPGWAGLESAAHWPEAVRLHRTAAGAVTSDWRREDEGVNMAEFVPSFGHTGLHPVLVLDLEFLSV